MPSFIVRKETKALAAMQLIFALMHCGLGTLWVSLYYVEEAANSVGPTLMVVAIHYLFVSSLFFINSGASSIVQTPVTSYKLILAIVMNIISVFVAIIGIVIFCVEFPVFEDRGDEYSWSNMAGMMLLQYSLVSTIAELVIAIIMVHWFRKAFNHQYVRRESSISDVSLPEEHSSSDILERTRKTSKKRERNLDR